MLYAFGREELSTLGSQSSNFVESLMVSFGVPWYLCIKLYTKLPVCYLQILMGPDKITVTSLVFAILVQSTVNMLPKGIAYP